MSLISRACHVPIRPMDSGDSDMSSRLPFPSISSLSLSLPPLSCLFLLSLPIYCYPFSLFSLRCYPFSLFSPLLSLLSLLSLLPAISSLSSLSAATLVSLRCYLFSLFSLQAAASRPGSTPGHGSSGMTAVCHVPVTSSQYPLSRPPSVPVTSSQSPLSRAYVRSDCSQPQPRRDR